MYRNYDDNRYLMKPNKKSNKDIDQYTHDNSRRSNNPPVGLVTPNTDPDQPSKKYCMILGWILNYSGLVNKNIRNLMWI